MTTLFSRDIFFDETPIFSEIDVKKSERIKAVFDTLYSNLNEEVTKVLKAGGFEINSNNFLIETTKASYLLKLSAKLSDAESVSLEKQSSLMAWLFNHQVPCPSPIKGKGGTYICPALDDEWVNLMTFVSGQYFPGSDECNIRKMGEAVGYFHTQLRLVPTELKPDKQYPYISSLDNEMFETTLLDSSSKLLNFPNSEKSLLLENKSLLLNSWSTVLAFEEHFMESERGLIHIDLHPHNLIMNQGELAAFLDFDSIMNAPLKMMIGFSAYKLLRQVVSRRTRQLSREEMNNLVESYLDGIYKYLPELKCGKNTLAIFTRTEICRRIAYILKLNIQDKNTQWNHVLAIQINGLKEIEILFDLLD